jgi:MoxR-like ATPase
VLASPSQAELERILGSTTTVEPPAVTPVLERGAAVARVEALQRLVRQVLAAPHVERYAAALVRLTAPAAGRDTDELIARYVAYGASPRGGQALLLGAKVRALLAGRPHVTVDDIDAVAVPALRHRLVLAFAAETDGVDAAALVERARVAARSRHA